MLEIVKQHLRVTDADFDEEITQLIAAAKDDIKLSGVKSDVVDGTGPLVQRAIVTYCKGMFGLDNKDSEKYLEAFRMMEIALAMSEEYGQGLTEVV